MELRILSLLLFCLLALSPRPSFAQNPSVEKLAQEMGARITRVPEFEFIREEAQKLGVRVYLFGGTAAAYGHYVRQDLARESGDKRYPKFLYDYDYTNIFRSTQDLDVVVDGPADKAEELEQILKTKFTHFVGDKEAKWEVRPLREARGDKEAILGNLDFANQHTDSHSTGMVEVTKTPVGEIPVKDVRDWESKKPQFLQDVAEQKLHYYFNPLHGTTKRARESLNPPILSAIRYLTKAFQYDLEISGEDRAKIQEIVNDFEPSSLKNDYVKKWVEKNGKKLFQHAVDIEYAWDTLDDLGLRQKLIDIKKNPAEVESLSWWMNKEPLRTKAVGLGKGKTAAELLGKNLVLAHETNSFLAFESITRSKSGELNGLVSREAAEGEAAAMGEGFYARLGRKGARGTGITIRMKLNPKARVGSDFTKWGDYIVIKNKAAVRVLPERIEMSLLEYFRFLAAGNEQSSDDRALLEAFHRRVGRGVALDPREQNELLSLLRKEFSAERPNKNLVREWFSLPVSRSHPDLLSLLSNRAQKDSDALLAELVLSQKHWGDQVGLLKEVLDRGLVDHTLALDVLTKDHWRPQLKFMTTLIDRALANDFDLGGIYKALAVIGSDHPEFIKKILREANEKNIRRLLKEVMFNEGWSRHPELLRPLLASGKYDEVIVDRVLASKGWEKFPEMVESLIDRGTVNRELAFLLARPNWRENHNLLLKYRRLNPAYAKFLLGINADDGGMVAEYWQKHIDVLMRLISDENPDAFLAQYVLPVAGWEKHPEILMDIIKRGNTDEIVAGFSLEQSHWRGHPELVEALLRKNNDKVNAQLVHTLKREHWHSHPEWIEQLLASGKYDKELAAGAQSLPQGLAEKVVNTILARGSADEELAVYAMNKKIAKKHPEWMEKLLANQSVHPSLATYALDSDNWRRRQNWIEEIVRSGAADEEVVKAVMRANRPDLLLELLRRDGADEAIANLLPKQDPERYGAVFQALLKKDTKHFQLAQVFEMPRWRRHPELLQLYLDTKTKSRLGYGSYLINNAFYNSAWKDHPEFIEQLMDLCEDRHMYNLLTNSNWKNNPGLLRATGGKEVTIENLRAAFAAGFSFRAKNIAVPKNCPSAFAAITP